MNRSTIKLALCIGAILLFSRYLSAIAIEIPAFSEMHYDFNAVVADKTLVHEGMFYRFKDEILVQKTPLPDVNELISSPHFLAPYYKGEVEHLLGKASYTYKMVLEGDGLTHHFEILFYPRVAIAFKENLLFCVRSEGAAQVMLEHPPYLYEANLDVAIRLFGSYCPLDKQEFARLSGELAPDDLDSFYRFDKLLAGAKGEKILLARYNMEPLIDVKQAGMLVTNRLIREHLGEPGLEHKLGSKHKQFILWLYGTVGILLDGHGIAIAIGNLELRELFRNKPTLLIGAPYNIMEPILGVIKGRDVMEDIQRINFEGLRVLVRDNTIIEAVLVKPQ